MHLLSSATDKHCSASLCFRQTVDLLAVARSFSVRCSGKKSSSPMTCPYPPDLRRMKIVRTLAGWGAEERENDESLRLSGRDLQ